MTYTEALVVHFCRDLTNKLDDVGYLHYGSAVEGEPYLVNFITAFATQLTANAEAALKREAANIGSVHRFLNGMIMTFDREGHQMPAFQGYAAEIIPLLELCGWKGDVQLSEVAA